MTYTTSLSLKQNLMFKPSRLQRRFLHNFDYGKEHGVIFANTTGYQFNGREIEIDGKMLTSFASCGYLGLDLDERVIEGSVDFTRRYGTTFSTSRTYLQHGEHQKLEEQLEIAFGGPCIIGPTTTLSHLAVFPALINKNDAIIADQQAHNSLQDAIVAMVGRGVHSETVPHNDMIELRSRIEKLSATHEKVWYVADGVYSIYGDLAPFKAIKELLDEFPKLIVYIDDAHGMGWAGKHGRGLALEEIGHHERLILVTSFLKAGASGGGLMVLPNQEIKDLVRKTGKTLTFSGPHTPGQLGALKAVTSILLSPEITVLQEKLADLCDFFLKKAGEVGLKIMDNCVSPIFYVSIGKPKTLIHTAAALQHKHGLFVSPTSFPAVSLDNSGFRITLTCTHTKEQIERLVTAIAIEQKEAYRQEANAAV